MNKEEIEAIEVPFWTKIQSERRCDTCLFFDKERKGKSGFCTYPFKLEIEQKDDREVCLKRRAEIKKSNKSRSLGEYGSSIQDENR